MVTILNWICGCFGGRPEMIAGGEALPYSKPSHPEGLAYCSCEAFVWCVPAAAQPSLAASVLGGGQAQNGPPCVKNLWPN
jgi:hypothetical protein